MAIVHQKRGDYDKALDFSYKTLALAEKIGTSPAYWRAITRSALFTRKGATMTGPWFSSEGPWDRRQNWRPGRCVCRISEYGIVYQKQGDYDKALELSHKALEIKEKSEDHHTILRIYGQIGLLHKLRGDYDTALDFTLKALGIAEKIGDIAGASTCYNQIGLVNHERENATRRSIFIKKPLRLPRR